MTSDNLSYRTMKKVPPRVNSHFSVPPLTYTYSRSFVEWSVYLAPASLQAFQKGGTRHLDIVDCSSFHCACWKKIPWEYNAHLCPPRVSLASLLSGWTGLRNPEVLTFSPSLRVRVCCSCRLWHRDPEVPGERAKVFQDRFSSWYKCPQMQHIILRHLCSHEVLLASPI